MPRPRIHPKVRRKPWKDPTKVADTMWAKRVWALRNATGWPRKILAEKLECGVVRVNGIIAGRTPPVRVILAIKREEKENAKALAEGRCLWTGKHSWFREISAFHGGRPEDLANALAGKLEDGDGEFDDDGGVGGMVAEAGMDNKGDCEAEDIGCGVDARRAAGSGERVGSQTEGDECR